MTRTPIALLVFLVSAVVGAGVPAEAAPRSPVRFAVLSADDWAGFDDDEELAKEPTEAEVALAEARKHLGSMGGTPDERRERRLECESLFTEIIESYPSEPEALEALYERGQIRRQLARPRLALEDFDRLLAATEHPKTLETLKPRALLGRAHCLLEELEWEPALEAFEAARASSTLPSIEYESLYYGGVCLRELGRFDEARSRWNQLIARASTDRFARRASSEFDTLRPPRERLRSLLEEFQVAKKKYDQLPYAQRARGARELGKVLERFGDLRIPESEAFLVDQFRKGDAGLKSEVVPPLLSVAGRDGARFLVDQLDELPPATKVAVLRGLSRRHLAEVDLRKFEPLVERPDALVSPAAIEALGRADSRAAAEILVGAYEAPKRGRALGPLLDQRNGEIARALRGLRDDEAWSFLIDQVLLGEKQPDGLRAVAAEALGYARIPDAGDKLLQALRRSGPELATAAVTSLGRLRVQEAVEPVVAQIDRRRTDSDFVRAAVETLGRLDPTPALEILLILSNSNDTAIRTLTVRALAKIDHPQALARVVGAVDDPAWQVRRSAFRAMRGRPSVPLIDALVARLPKEEGALLPDLLRLLIAFTGQDYGPDPVKWSEFWNFERENYVARTDEGDGKKGGTHTYVKKADADAVDSPTYFGVEIISKQVAFIVDTSGSMSARVRVPGESGQTTESTRIELAKTELIGAIEKLRPGTRFNIIKFGSTFSAMSDKLLRLSKKSQRDAIRFAQGLGAAGGTNIYDSLEFVLEAGDVDTIFLLSDGAPSAGRYTDPNRILEEVRRLNAVSQVTIHTISIGFESPFMRRLATENDGNAIVVGQ